jgi:SAM-dependent methyltransferase
MQVEEDNVRQFIEMLQLAVSKKEFVKLTLGKNKSKDFTWKNVYGRLVSIKNKECFSFTYRHATNDIVKNYPIEEALVLLVYYLQNGCQHASCFTLMNDFILDCSNSGAWKLRLQKASFTSLDTTEHNKPKQKLLQQKEHAYFYDLGLSNADGVILKNAQDKFKQINHYIELLRPHLEKWPSEKVLRILDMGSGKGYLTFALAKYVADTLQLQASITGIEMRPDLVELGNRIAKKYVMPYLNFVQATIQTTKAEDCSMLIALHACDTATDDAIFYGIQQQAELIVVAPCCHKEMRRQMEKSNKPFELHPICKHGIFLERQAEMLTDSLRALVLEASGYKVKIIDFISDAHTPKNILIIAERAKDGFLRTENAMKKLFTFVHYFGIKQQHLMRLMKMKEGI